MSRVMKQTHLLGDERLQELFVQREFFKPLVCCCRLQQGDLLAAGARQDHIPADPFQNLHKGMVQ